MNARLAALALAATGCATTHLPPAGSPGYRLEEDERTLRRLSGELEARIDGSGAVIEAPELEAYLAEVVRRIEPPAVLAAMPVRVRVIRDFRLNAFALAKGAVYLHSGLLARMESEAELAMVLGHEITHATHRHALRSHRDAANKTSFLAAVSAPLAGIPFALGGVHGVLSSIAGYSRELENEADANGLALLAAAGYEGADSIALLRRLADWAQEEKIAEPFFYATHPRLAERIESCGQILAANHTAGSGGIRNAESFQRATASLVLDDARHQLAAGRFAAAERGARKYLRLDPASAPGEAVLGEVERQRGGATALAAAADHYRRAIGLDPSLAEAHRGLGLVLLKSGDRAGAMASLQRYLALSPGAPDRAYVEKYLEQGRD